MCLPVGVGGWVGMDVHACIYTHSLDHVLCCHFIGINWQANVTEHYIVQCPN